MYVCICLPIYFHCKYARYTYTYDQTVALIPVACIHVDTHVQTTNCTFFYVFIIAEYKQTKLICHFYVFIIMKYKQTSQSILKYIIGCILQLWRHQGFFCPQTCTAQTHTCVGITQVEQHLTSPSRPAAALLATHKRICPSIPRGGCVVPAVLLRYGRVALLWNIQSPLYPTFGKSRINTSIR